MDQQPHSDKLTAEETSELLKDVEAVLARIENIAKAGNKKTGFCIGNTTKKIERDYFLTPLRNADLCVCGSIIIDRVAISEVLIAALDGKVDYIFIDTEKKISPSRYGHHDAGNVERTARGLVQKSAILTYKGNDLIVDDLDCFLAQKLVYDERGSSGKKVAVVGAGNIGFKLAIKLTERGANVHLVRRDAQKLEVMVQALNYIKPKGTMAQVEGSTNILEAIEGADVVIGLTPGTGDITAEMISKVKKTALLVDAGKGSFSKDAIRRAAEYDIPVWRPGIVSSFEGQVAMLIKAQSLLKRESGHGTLAGVPVVGAGLIGNEGEVVVDDMGDPREVYGIADGHGDFIRIISDEHHLQMETLRKYIQDREKSERDEVLDHAN